MDGGRHSFLEHFVNDQSSAPPSAREGVPGILLFFNRNPRKGEDSGFFDDDFPKKSRNYNYKGRDLTLQMDLEGSFEKRFTCWKEGEQLLRAKTYRTSRGKQDTRYGFHFIFIARFLGIFKPSRFFSESLPFPF